MTFKLFFVGELSEVYQVALMTSNLLNRVLG